jgi:hypothetical protein
MHNITKEKLIDAVKFKPSRVVFPYNTWGGHIPFAGWIIKIHKPSVFVELGTHSGNSYFAFCESAKESALNIRCYAIDTWQGDVQAGAYGESIYNDVAHHNEALYAKFSTLLRMTFDEALEKFDNHAIDLLHIDGLHTYEAVKHDFESWLPKLSNRAIVLFHDISVRENEFGVWKLWEELSAIYPSASFQHSHGLGVLLVGKDIEKDILDDILYCNEPSMKTFFLNLGEAVITKSQLHDALDKIKKIKSKKSPLKRLIRRIVGSPQKN